MKGHLLFATDDSIMEAYLRDDGRGRGLTAGKDGFGEAIQEVGGVQTGLFGYQTIVYSYVPSWMVYASVRTISTAC